MNTLLFLLILFTLVVIPMSHYAAAHGVSTGGFAPSFGRIDDVSLSKQSIQTGETITVTGKIVYMQQYHTQGWLAVHSDPGPYGRWTIVSTQPSEHLIDIPGNSLIPFSITVKALQPGIYHFSPEVYLVGIGPAMSSLNGNNRTEPIVVVTGKPICMQDLVAISKVEDNSSACVKYTTAQKLIERGWGMSSITSLHDGTLSGNVVRAGGPRSGPQVNYEIDVYASDGITIVGKTFSDTQGNYSVSLPAGNYTIYAPDYPTKQTYHVSVISGKNTILNIAYGTGYK